jgi:hypothetical protein
LVALKREMADDPGGAKCVSACKILDADRGSILDAD